MRRRIYRLRGVGLATLGSSNMLPQVEEHCNFSVDEGELISNASVTSLAKLLQSRCMTRGVVTLLFSPASKEQGARDTVEV